MPNPASLRCLAQVAQLVEQRTENPRVGGSIPPLGTIFSCFISISYNLRSNAFEPIFMSHMLQSDSNGFEWIPGNIGCSTRHGRNMAGLTQLGPQIRHVSARWMAVACRAFYLPTFCLLISVQILAWPHHSLAASALHGRPEKIWDGDTIVINGHRIRLHGIDTPEKKERCIRDGKPWDCAADARRALTERIGSNEVECDALDTDKFGRIVALCFVGETMLNDWMVMTGWAIDYTKYSNCAFRKTERKTRAKGINLWAANVDELSKTLAKRLRERKKSCPN